MDPLTPNLYSPFRTAQFMKNNQNDPEWVALYNDYLKNENGIITEFPSLLPPSRYIP
jgi:hypothetical protein